MRTRDCLALLGAALLLGCWGGNASAQLRPGPGTSRPAGGSFGRPMAAHGTIIGNRKSHTYHMPGDKGTLPAEKNRVYFQTEAQAVAAGYHRSGTKKPIGRMAPHNGRMAPHGLPSGRPTP